MLGVDKAKIKAIKLLIDADQLKINIFKMFNLKGDIKAISGEKIYIGEQENINEKFKYINYLKITKNKHYCSLEIEFNYSRYFRRTNFELTTIQKDKEIVDFNILLIISELIEKKVGKFEYSYSNLEVAEQMKIKKFTDFTNVIFLLYKALKNSKTFELKGKMFLDYSNVLDTFYTTGFTVNFKNELSGLKFTTYNKTLENNDNNEDFKERITVLKNEFAFIQSNLQTMFGSSAVESLSLIILKNKISDTIGKEIKKAVIDQLIKNQKEIEKRLDKISLMTPRAIQLFVTENNEFILDYDWFNCILKKKLIRNKPERTIRRYQSSAKEKLISLGNSNSPKRSNSKNIKKLQEYLRILFGVEIEIILRKDGEIQIF